MIDMLHHHSERYRMLSLTHRISPRDVGAEHQQLMETTLARTTQSIVYLVTRPYRLAEVGPVAGRDVHLDLRVALRTRRTLIRRTRGVDSDR